MTSYVVSSAAELKSALSSANDGDNIALRAGDYGDVKLSHLEFTSEVTISAYDAEPPRFNSIALWNCDNLTFDGINVDFTPDADTVEWSAAIRADISSGIKVINSTITGGNAVAGIDMDAEAGTQGRHGINGYPIGVGMSFYNSADITVENNTISQFSSGVRFHGTDGISMNYNEVHSVRKVPVGGGNVDNVNMEGNYFHDLTPWKFGGAGDHGDFVHFWTTPDQDGPSENFVFKENFFAQGDGVPVLGIYLDDNTNDIGFTNVLVENNVLHNSNAQGLRMEDVVGLTVINNTMVQGSGGDAQDAPRIYLATGTRDVIISNNIYAGVSGSRGKDLTADNITITDNKTVQVHDPLADNYAGTLFVDALASSPSLEDLSVVPGSMLDGYGANITTAPEGRITYDRGEGLALATQEFDLVLEGAGEVTWDFGDGTIAQGRTVQHTFSSAGTYIATAKIQYEDGTEQNFTKTIHALNPVGYQADFDDGLQENVTIKGDVEFAEGHNGTAVRLTSPRSTVTFEATDDLLNNPEYTISLAFRKEPGQESSGGRIFYFSGTAVVDLGATGITLRGVTDASESIVLRSGNLGLDDSDWHQFTYTASKTDGSAVLYVDGVEVARMDGLTGGQYTTMGHNMHLGNPFGNNFTGLLDEATFLRAALTPEEVLESYEAFRDGAGMLNYNQEAEILTDPDANEGTATTPNLDDPVTEASPEEVETPNPVVLSYTAENGLVTFENGDAAAADIIGATTSGGIYLGGQGSVANIARTHVTDILEQDSFAISMTLTSSGPQSAGEIMRLHSSFTASVTSAGELNLYLCGEDGGRRSITTQGANLSDMDPHDINISYSNGSLQIIVNGNVLASAEGIEPLADAGQHNLTFGNPWNGTNFDGVLSQLAISLSDEPIDSQATVPDYDLQDPTPLPENPSTDTAPELSAVLSYTAENGLITFENGDAAATGITGTTTSGGIYLGGQGSVANIARTHVTDILEQDSFSISMTLTSSGPQSAGEIMRLHSSFTASVTSAGELNLYLCGEDGGRRSITTQGANLSDMAPHDINISYASGSLKIIVNGNLLASAEGIEPLADVGQHNLTFGNPWNGTNFDGVLSQFSISLSDEPIDSQATVPDVQMVTLELPFEQDDDPWTSPLAETSTEIANPFETMLTTGQDDYFI